MIRKRCIFLLFASLALLISCDGSDVTNDLPEEDINPPFSGTIFIDPDIITSADQSTFETIDSTGIGSRTMFDRRINGWITVEAFLFYARYENNRTIEVQVNPEFETEEAARVQAQKYAIEIGRLPFVLRRDVETVWIHKGENPFGGGNNNLLIHIGQAENYINDGILEETLVHEAAHTSLDADHAQSAGWVQAQKSDPTFISTYAQENEIREDIAESFLTYLAVKYRENRISEDLKKKILKAIPNRIAYFESQSFNVFPIQ